MVVASRASTVVLAFGARVLADARALDIVDVFLHTDFEGGRHQPRIEQLAGIEAGECGNREAAPPV